MEFYKLEWGWSTINLIITDKIEKQDEETVFAGLLAYNMERLENKTPKDLGIFMKNEEGTLLAGLTGNTHGSWLSIKYFWISEELRGQGLGSLILERAEQVAVERGCKYVFLDTFDFQAPKFYQKHGYKEVFALEEYPVTGKRHYYTKILA